MDSLSAQWRDWARRFDALTARERWMVTLAAVSVLIFLWDSWVTEPGRLEYQRTVNELPQLQARQQVAEAGIIAVQQRARTDPNAGVRARLQSLRAELDELSRRRSQLDHALIEPAGMTELLRRLLQQQPGLRLVSLQSQEAEPLFGDAKKSGAESDMPAVFKHGIHLEFQADSYFDVLGYLQSLERQPLCWDSIDFAIQTHPQARVKLKVYTLSFSKGWLGA